MTGEVRFVILDRRLRPSLAASPASSLVLMLVKTFTARTWRS
jgi:hypothetical protein